jgi:hypothetical protein
MGTRNLTVVISGGKRVVAQYCQWDGYPSGQGATALKFLSSEGSLDKLKKALEKVRFRNEEDEKEAAEYYKSIGCDDSGWVNMEQSALINKRYPLKSRDHGAEILGILAESDLDELVLVDNFSFGYYSLFCEFAYVVDLDNNTFEVYEGFQQEILDKSERFYKEEDSKGYYGVKLIKSYNLSSLPTEEVFLKELEPQDEEDED